MPKHVVKSNEYINYCFQTRFTVILYFGAITEKESYKRTENRLYEKQNSTNVCQRMNRTEITKLKPNLT